jgi:acyl dehydratase
VEAVPVGSRLRGHFTVKDVFERKPGQQLTLFDVVQEIEHTERPALTAEWESLWVRPTAPGAGG